MQRAKAWSAYIYDRIEIGDWVIAPGLRYEGISQKRIRWETRVGRTSDPSSRAAHNYRDSRANDTTVLLPGLGAVYTIADGHALVAGVHKGFTAPSNAPDVDEEESLNYELGYRFFSEDSRAEVMLFLSDYDNLLGECTSSSGKDCEAGDAFNGDAATVKGLELSMVTNLRSGSGLMFPLSFSYTYLHGEFDSDIADTDFFGDVSRGDPLPYLPEHRINADLGMESGDWGAYLNLHYVDEVCVRASCGAFERTDSAWLADLSVRYQLSEVMNLYGRLENLSDNDAILGRHPYGARPARGRSFALGLSAEF